MVQKIVFLMEDSYDEHPYDISHLLQKNNELCSMVTVYKNKITQYHVTKQWDKFKKLSNEYELIFTTPYTGSNISEYAPVSRSFFKLWEILHDFYKEILYSFSETPIKCLFIAEGPGGFAEAVIKYRETTSEQASLNDEYHGITLKSFNDKNIPEWKMQKDCMKKVKINYGEDQTGNIYNVRNIHFLAKELGQNSIEFITADGGFDFSSDFNGQEEQSFKLVLCEIYASLLLQKPNGTFVLKVFDMFHETTLKLIQLLKQCYETIYISKPLTSRPANSEKYLVCMNFKLDKDTKKVRSTLFQLIVNYSDEYIKNFFETIPFDINILTHLVNYNIYYTLRQIYYIERTIQYINIFSNKQNEDLMHKILDYHANKSKKWCIKYNL